MFNQDETSLDCYSHVDEAFLTWIFCTHVDGAMLDYVSGAHTDGASLDRIPCTHTEEATMDCISCTHVETDRFISTIIDLLHNIRTMLPTQSLHFQHPYAFFGFILQHHTPFALKQAFPHTTGSRGGGFFSFARRSLSFF